MGSSRSEATTEPLDTRLPRIPCSLAMQGEGGGGGGGGGERHLLLLKRGHLAHPRMTTLKEVTKHDVLVQT